jgi:wyosine [tRNA(Phe)-imidazoG37] synthetase (radical SAM superfamily)
MGTFLFDKTIFGPIKSRRFGDSLGINLLPNDYKLCNLDCVYCECGWTLTPDKKVELPSYEEVAEEFENYLKKIKSEGVNVDSFTFAGNGEPTVHPEFPKIIDLAIELRDKYYPKAMVAVLSNGILFNRQEIKDALHKVDLPVLKLDAGTDETYHLIDRPKTKKTLAFLAKEYRELSGKIVIQTLFLRGEYEGKKFDNTTEEEIGAWVQLVKGINPIDVMIYSLERDTPASSLVKVEREKLEEIAQRLQKEGVKASVY